MASIEETRVEDKLGGDFAAAAETLYLAALDGFRTTEADSDVPSVWPVQTGYDVSTLTDLMTKLEDVVLPALRVAIAGRPLTPDLRWDGERDASVTVMGNVA